MGRLQQFDMNNRASPLASARPHARLALNAELPAPGRFVRRRGIALDADVHLQVGSAAPFRSLFWMTAAGTWHVVCGQDGQAFVNPFNNMLYARTSEGACIYGDGEDAQAEFPDAWGTVQRASWGLSAPATQGVMTEVEAQSALAAGYYKVAVTSFDPTTWCESPPLFLAGTAGEGLGWHTDKLQEIRGADRALGLPEITGLAGRARIYRCRHLAGGQWPAWQTPPQLAAPARYLRLVEEPEAVEGTLAARNDLGGQVEARLLSYDHEVVPLAFSAAFHEGRWWHFRAADGTYRAFYTRPNCPETYAAVEHAVLAELEAGIQCGKGEVLAPADCGPPVGQVARGGNLLLLCRLGCWPVVRHGEVNLYAVGRDPSWIGCASDATVAQTPWAALWIAPEGIAAWDGDAPPRILTLAVLDPEDPDTAFAADLSAASAAYDPRRRRYVACVPKAGGGQFLLVLHLDYAPDAALTVWTRQAALPPVAGMGYDPDAGELVFLFGGGETPVTAKTPKDACWRDETDDENGSVYPCTLEAWDPLPEHRGEQKADLGARVTIHRTDASGSQSLTATLAGLKTAEEAASAGATAAITWTPGEYGAKRFPGPPAQGRLARLTLTHQANEALEVREVQIAQGEDLKRADERPG